MQDRHVKFRRAAASALGLALAGSPLPMQAADNYVDALQAEAHSLDKSHEALKPQPLELPAGGWSQEGQGLKDGLTQNLAKSQFEEELKQNFFGTYMFYSKLNNTDREAVYTEYRASGRLIKVRDKITELMKR